MKAVDITLFVQVINFFIAYWFLRKYVFVPVAQILEAEELERTNNQKFIQEALNQRDCAKKSIRLRMLQIKQSLLEHVPSETQEIFSDLKSQKADHLSENIILSEQERQDIKKIISDKISEVDL